jgi:hypothetical protein
VRWIVEVVLDVHAARHRGVDADELQGGSHAEAVEEAGTERRGVGLDLGSEPVVQVEVVGELVAVVRALAVGGLVVADGWEEGHTVEDVPIGFVEARVPLIILVARAGGVLVAEGDVVPGGDDEPHAARVDRSLERLRDQQLAAAVEASVDDPDAEVADHSEGDGNRRVAARKRPKAVVVVAAGPDQGGLLHASVV